MAQKVVRTLVDDLSGEESDEITTNTILVNGAGVEIDLTSENYDRLLELLNPYFHAKGARRVRRGSGAKGKGHKERGRGDSSEIRAWARENNYEVTDRGRVPARIREAYEESR
ncbi:Lsr2 family protein [Streptomyces lasiicapitis]|uniref:histone-like nucleoid-structuring protein Lsr2 n=1 Tax=Streptomyces lasiicapitis TaxID=1923961 RepID=UPI00332009CD